MITNNFSIKKLKKFFVSINGYIENLFNEIRYFKTNYRKILFSKDNRVFLVASVFALLILTYFLIPTLYDKNIIQRQIESHIAKKYEIKIKFNENIKYGLLPLPHFVAKDLSIMRDDKQIGLSKNFKIFIKINNFLKINEIQMKTLIFNKTDFDLNKNDIIFFKNLLKTEPNENKILFKNSKIFFKNENDELLFINKIYDADFYYDQNKLENVLVSKNKVFNFPYKLQVKNDKFNKILTSKFSSQKIRLNLKNVFNYDDENKAGFLDVSFVNDSTTLKYKIGNNAINFESDDIKKFYDGLIEIKPFYFTANFNYDGLSSKNLFNEENLLVDLIKSEIFLNKNLNANIKLNVKDITNINELNDLKLNILIDEGNIRFSDSYIKWKDDLKISLDESFLNYDGNQINLDGKITFDFDDLENFYRSFQIKKINRKKIKRIELYFVYNFNQNKITFSNARIDNSPNLKIEEYFENFNEDQSFGVFNKVKFKNFINNFFKIYAG